MIRVGERELVARVTLADPPAVEVDGVTLEVTAIAGGRTHVRARDDSSQRVVTLDDQDLPGAACVAGLAVPIVVRTAQAAAREAALAAGRTGSAGGGKVKAPMPGRVVRVLVAPDQEVERGAPLVIVEAMKMENELRAPRPGVIATIKAKPGNSVNQGDVLITLH